MKKLVWTVLKVRVKEKAKSIRLLCYSLINFVVFASCIL